MGAKKKEQPKNRLLVVRLTEEEHQLLRWATSRVTKTALVRERLRELFSDLRRRRPRTPGHR